jgi:hypothetical protein
MSTIKDGVVRTTMWSAGVVLTAGAEQKYL